MVLVTLVCNCWCHNFEPMAIHQGKHGEIKSTGQKNIPHRSMVWGAPVSYKLLGRQASSDIKMSHWALSPKAMVLDLTHKLQVLCKPLSTKLFIL